MVRSFTKRGSVAAIAAWLIILSQSSLVFVPAAHAGRPRPVPSPSEQPIALQEAPVAGVVTERVSVSSTGEQGNGASYAQSTGQFVSADGRFVTFNSLATNLAPNDYGARDVFVRDRLTGTTELVSVTLAGLSAGQSSEQAIAANGKTVAFGSGAADLVPTPVPPGVHQVYVRDLLSGTTELVSVASDGSPGDDTSENPNLSADGRFVVFSSLATNLVPGSEGVRQIYLHDRMTGSTDMLSVDDRGYPGNRGSDQPAISDDGNIVAFVSQATNLLANDRNGANFDVFVHDRRTGITELASVSPAGNQSGYSWFPSLSADGLFVAFEGNASDSCASSMCVFVRDRIAGTTTHASVNSTGEPAAGASGGPRLSADARFVAFYSDAGNLDQGDANRDYDVFVRDLRSGVTRLASVADSGTAGDARSWNPSLSADGRVVAFETWASTLAADDTNGGADVLVRAASADVGACDPSRSWLPECSVTGSGAAPSPPSYLPPWQQRPLGPLPSYVPPWLQAGRPDLIPAPEITGTLTCLQWDKAIATAGQRQQGKPMQQVPIEIGGYGTVVTDEDGFFHLEVPAPTPQSVHLRVSYDKVIWGSSNSLYDPPVGTRLQVMDEGHRTRTDEEDRYGTLQGNWLDLGTIMLITKDCDLWNLGVTALRDYHGVMRESPPAGELRIKRWSDLNQSAAVAPHTSYDHIVIPTNFGEEFPYLGGGVESYFNREHVIFHEFAHTVRHVASAGGDRAKFDDDFVRFTYGRHWQVDNMGNAFNEGWATYWHAARRHGGALPSFAQYKIQANALEGVGGEYRDWNEYLVADRLLQLSDRAEGYRVDKDRFMMQVLKDNPGAIFTLYDFEVKFFKRLEQGKLEQGNDRLEPPASCPPSWDDHLASCSNRSTNTVIAKTSYSRGVGLPIASCPEGQEEDRWLCYDLCPPGYDGVGPVCWQGLNSDVRGVGTPLTCAPGLEYDTGLCYTPCISHYHGVGPGCWY